MNKKLSIGLIVGGILILGMGSYLLYKKSKKLGKKDKKSDDGKKLDGDISSGGTDTKGKETDTKGKETDTKGKETDGSTSGSTTTTTSGSTTTTTSGSTSGSTSTGDAASTNTETITALKDAYDNLSFETGSNVIKSTSLKYLDELADVLKKSTWGLKLDGHTDNTGDAKWNLTLSKRRADAVKKYLVLKGIEESRITTEGFGITKPIADNKTAEGRAKNRRVEFKIIK